MIYYKHHGRKLEIQEDQFFAICPRCGREHQIDLADIVLTAGENYEGLENMVVYCERCTAIRMMMD